MKIANNIYNRLRNYVAGKEVVFQFFDGLVEVSNVTEIEQKEELLSYFNKESNVETCTRESSFIKDKFSDLKRWATEDDVFFLLQNVGVLICVTRKEAIDNELIVA